MSEATILHVVERVAEELKPIYEVIQERVRESEYVNADETGWRIKGTNHWLWVFDTLDAVLFRIDKTRSSRVPKAVLGEDYEGIVGCDGYTAYSPLECSKQQCLIHINRELQKVEAKRGIVPRPLTREEDPSFTRRGRPPAQFLKFAKSLRKILREAIGKWGRDLPIHSTVKRRLTGTKVG